MTFYGADTEAVREVGERFRDAGSRLEDIQRQLSVAVMNPLIWQGPDADQLRETWAGEVAPRLGSIADDVSGRRDELEKHAEEQDEASHEKGALETIWDAIKIGVKGFSLFKAGKSILSGIDDMKRLGETISAAAAETDPETAPRLADTRALTVGTMISRTSDIAKRVLFHLTSTEVIGGQPSADGDEITYMRVSSDRVEEIVEDLLSEPDTQDERADER